MLKKHSLTWANRAETEFDLEVFEGKIPEDLSGFAFFNSPVGTVNSGGTPIPQTLPDGQVNPEWGQMVFNGDGLLFRFDFSRPGKIRVKTKLLTTPDYWADLATKQGTDYYKQGLHFDAMGMARTSQILGSRNQINTSVNLFKTKAHPGIRLTANFDAGRPFEIDPVTLETLRPIGLNTDWHGEMPNAFNQLFLLHQSTAHPSFDPRTQEFFTVNFQKDFFTLVFSEKFKPHLTQNQDWLTRELEGLIQAASGLSLKGREYLNLIDHFVKHLEDKHSLGHDKPFVLPDAGTLAAVPGDLTGMVNAVNLMRWNGESQIDSWNVLDPDTNQNLVIEQTMHQTALSKDWIILVDTSLKFAIDIMENNPFPNLPELNALLRKFTARTIQPVTPVYLIDRRTLGKPGSNVKASKVWIPLETVHFSVDYENPEDVVTLYTSHNSASCAAEWVRPYDVQAVDHKPVQTDVIGIMAAGEMDIGRVGVFKIKAPDSKILSQTVIHQTGTEPGSSGLHTWASGLNTYWGANDPEHLPATIPYIFWQFYGLDRRILTRFIQDLYSEYQNRIIPVDQILALTKQGVPFCLSRQNTVTQAFEDGYVFKMNENLRSLQFVPKKGPAPEGLAPELHGYIVCTMINGDPDLSKPDYTREVWIFEAARLRQGPVAKLSHPDLSFAFTIHSIWCRELTPAPVQPKYDIRQDYEPVLATITDPARKAQFKTLLEKEVYPHYE